MIANSRPTQIEVTLGALSHNLKFIRDQVGRTKILAVVKANAYGHGLIPVARHFEDEQVDFLGVALVEEGLMLRKSGIKTPILVFGGLLGDQVGLYIDNNLDLTASSISKLELIDSYARSVGRRARVHLKIDCGMERIGVHTYSAESFVAHAKRAAHIDVVGVYSHFPSAETELAQTKEQLKSFLDVASSFPGVIRHIANSAAIFNLAESHLDMVRPGLALYGVAPIEKTVADLRPALRLTSRVVYFKVVKQNAGISYGSTYRPVYDTRVVTVPIGYGDGYSRQLSNCGAVLIRGRRYPIVGRICMDQLMVDIGPDGEAYNGDLVVLLGRDGNETISAWDISMLANTIPHDTLCSLNERIPRRYVV